MKLGTRQMHRLGTLLLVLAILGPLAAPLTAQTAEIPRRTEPYSWTSDRHDGIGIATERPALTREDIISIPGAPWMQLKFDRGELGKQSYLEITSLADGATQHLDAETLAQWNNRSAYFNGDAVSVRLFVGPFDRGVSIDIHEIVAGEWGPPPTKSICGSTDNRVASTEPRVGRIDPIGCTGWIIDSGQLLSAGHCLDGGSSNQTLSFNVPPSLSNGTVQFPGPEDQYTINQGSFNFVDGGVGNDWGVFAVFDNSQTGQQPIQAQGSFTVRQDLGPANIRITGFGVDSGTTNQTNQTHVGPNAGSSGNTMRYVTDTQGGNSGSPVIDEATGEAVGIHTHGGCTSSGGNNNGTSFFNSALWNAIDTTPPPPACSNQLYSADFEGGGADGWTNDGASTCSTGDFLAATPTQVVNGGVTTQVGGAAGGSGAWFTATNSSAGVNDVDGGTCDTRSPTVTVGAGDVTVNFDYFHGQRDAGDDSSDGFVIDVLNGSGAVIDTIVNIGDVTRNAAWTAGTTTFNVGGDTNIRLRVRATDGSGPGDLVEGGIDNVEICANDPGGPPPGGCTVDDDFESGSAAGWTNDAASTCSTGDYVVNNPTQVVNSGVTTQVGGSNSGVFSIFTATNSSAGVNDVDGGNCILSSPSWSVSAASTLSVAYWHGQRDAGDDAAGDFFRLEYSTNGGSSWTALASNGDSTSNAAWSTATAQIPAGSSVELRVQCSDGSGPGDLVECGIDDVSICDN